MREKRVIGPCIGSGNLEEQFTHIHWRFMYCADQCQYQLGLACTFWEHSPVISRAVCLVQQVRSQKVTENENGLVAIHWVFEKLKLIGAGTEMRTQYLQPICRWHSTSLRSHWPYVWPTLIDRHWNESQHRNERRHWGRLQRWHDVLLYNRSIFHLWVVG